MEIELVEDLVTYYRVCYKEIEKTSSLKKAKNILKEYKTELGICAVAIILFRKNIYNDKHIKEITRMPWYSDNVFPIFSITTEELKRSLQLRITSLMAIQLQLKSIKTNGT